MNNRTNSGNCYWFRVRMIAPFALHPAKQLVCLR